MTTIFLHGELADRFGSKWVLNVASVGEAIRAIESQKPGLLEYFGESEGRGVDFNVKVNDVDQRDETDLRATRKIDTINISPVVRGSKRGVLQLIVGIILIVVAVVFQQYYLYGYAIKSLAGVGIAMAIGGVAQMIAGTPKTPGSVDDGGPQSSLFSGPENTSSQGGPVPLCYGGPILVGSQVVSAGIFTEDTTYVDTAYPDGGGGFFGNVRGAFHNAQNDPY
jgi:predicted phage tail protein